MFRSFITLFVKQTLDSLVCDGDCEHKIERERAKLISYPRVTFCLRWTLLDIIDRPAPEPIKNHLSSLKSERTSGT